MIATLSADTGCTHLPLPFALSRGGALAPALCTWERVGPADAPLVVVLGGISAHRHVTATPDDPRPGWWSAQVGPGRAIDTDRFAVLGVDWLSAPDGALVGTDDQARAVLLVLDALGVGRAHRVVGASFGGMVALALAALAPERVDALVAISAPHRPHPAATAWRGLQRDVVRLGLRLGDGAGALAIARGIALCTYRTPEELGERFAADDADPDGAPVEAWLRHHGARFAATEDPARWLGLARALDAHRVDPAAVRVPTTLVGVPEDRLVPFAQLQELHRTLAGPARLVRLPSRHGHDAFLVEEARVDAVLRDALGSVPGQAGGVA